MFAPFYCDLENEILQEHFLVLISVMPKGK